MSARPAAGGGAVTALVAALTTWVAMLAWRGFTAETHRFLAPLAVLGVLVAGTGALLRWWRTPAALVVLVQVVVSALVAAAIISGSVLPVGSGWAALREAFVTAHESANTFAPPVPAGVPGVHPFLIAGGLGCLLLVDLFACTLRRAPLAGLPLLSIYSIPVGMLGIDLVWWVFALTAVGFLVLLHLEQGDRVRRWGRTLDSSGRARGSATSAVRWHAGVIGGGVTAVAVVLPLVIPTLSVQLLDFGRGPGGNGDIKVVNPTTDLRRDLVQQRDVPLVRMRTDDPAPAYLRIAVLNRFSDNEWSSGDRDIPSSQRADGPLPPLVGVGPTATRTSYSYDLAATGAFDSTWLPTPAQTTTITAPGDWRYDGATRDFIAGDDDLTTSGLDWRLQADVLDLDANAMATAGSSVGLVSSSMLDVPQGIDPYVRNLAFEVTRDAASPFEKAVALQNWFRESGNFTYSTDIDLGTGTDDLVRFLSPARGGRVGYCEQFASSMALMARQLSIPARVAVGFLTPDRTGPDTWQYSSHDLHSWPELFFAGAGWVRFEPTPPTRASGVPDYTEQGVTPVNPDVANAPGGDNPDEELPRNADSASPAVPQDTPDTAATDDASSVAWWPYVVTVLVVALLALLLATPGLVRRRRRERRRGAGIEAAWAELRDTARDLGLHWIEHRSPRETATALAAQLELGVVRVAASDRLALDRLVDRLERTRYAPGVAAGPTGPAADAPSDLDRVLTAMTESVSPTARRRAAWLPRSVFRRRTEPAADPTGSAGDDERLLERV